MAGINGSVKNIALEIINDYMGEVTAQLYKKFYQDKGEDLVLNSISALLAEYVGDGQATTILRDRGLGGKL